MVLLILSIPKTFIFSKVCNNLGNYDTEYNVVRIFNDQKYFQLTIYPCKK
jgi:hypothetical protein